MSQDTRVLQLVEEALIDDRTPEQVCAASPELLPAVRAEWERCRRLDLHLAGLFPSAGVAPGSDEGDGSAGGARTAGVPAGPPGLPPVPGYAAEVVLGRGGVGVVYRARHLKLDRAVALKMLLSGAYAGPVERARFLREARAVAALRHPHVVQVYDVGEHDGRPYFTMELMDGGSLADRLGGVPLPAAEAASLVETIAGAVETAHRAGIVHRDLKPANVLLAGDGTAKVSDFGLALRADGGGGDRPEEGGDAGLALTLTGVPLGTPSYMAPEQVAGRRGAVGPAADVYALGAVLYETLTGRPPFRAESAVETQRQVAEQEPVPPSRLNPRVPRDLETVCLKCLAKEPGRRYASAAALVEDLGRFERGEPVAARRTGRWERAAKWVRRRPAVAALWAGGTLVGLGLAGGMVSWATDRAATARAVADDLDRVERLQREAHWDEADALLKHAEMRLRDRGSAALRARTERARRDAELVRRLDAIRLVTVTGSPGNPRARREYADAFREAGIGDDFTDRAAAAARVRASNIRAALVVALYDWVRAAEAHQRVPLLVVAHLADPDPTGWSRRALDPATWRDPAAAAAASADPGLAGRSPDLLLFAGELMADVGRDPVPFLRRVRQAHPSDFWVNLTLGNALTKARDIPEAVRFCQAAVVLRPEAAVAHDCLGTALRHAGRIDESIAEYREAIRIDPRGAPYRANLGGTLVKIGRADEAIGELAVCLSLSSGSEDAVARGHLADALEAVGRPDEAVEQLRTVITRTPTALWAQPKLKDLLVRRGRWDEALAAWRPLLDRPYPPEGKVWAGYAECCLFRGNADEYRRACRLLLDRFADSTDPQTCDVVGRTSLLSPPPEPDLRRATALIDRALAIDRARPTGVDRYFRAAKGLAEYRGGSHKAAIAIMEGDVARVLGPVPQLVVAMARWRLGQPAEARRALARAVVSRDWSPVYATSADDWMYHVLRREAEAMILPELPAFLEGRHQPRDQDERLALVGICQFENRTATAAGLYADAFDADPALAEDLSTACRFAAARRAAMAGCGRGSDAAGLTEPERARWREQARAWLGADLAIRERALKADPASAERTRGALTRWQTEPDFAGLREPAELGKLPADEQRAWAAFWLRVGEVLSAAQPKG